MKKLFLLYTLLLIIISCDNKNTDNSSIDTSYTTDSLNIAEENSFNSEDNALVKAPDFSLPDLNGNLKSLKDFEGKLIYLDIWATWCGPCRVQIPALQTLEKKYRGNDIIFLSISVDPEKDKEVWKKMVTDKNMSGEHLYAGVKSSTFGLDYKVEYIPKFLIISPTGDILMDNAPQPMNFETGDINPDLVQIFDLYLKTNTK